MKKIILEIVIGCTFIFSLPIHGQIGSETYCTNPSRLAKYRVELFLTLPDRENLRQKSGVINESVGQISIVSDEQDCYALDIFVANNRKYNKINESVQGTNETIYYYQTANFYYVFWHRKPEFDDRPSTGPKTLFLVIKKDLSQLWEFYL